MQAWEQGQESGAPDSQCCGELLAAGKCAGRQPPVDCEWPRTRFRCGAVKGLLPPNFGITCTDITCTCARNLHPFTHPPTRPGQGVRHPLPVRHVQAGHPGRLPGGAPRLLAGRGQPLGDPQVGGGGSVCGWVEGVEVGGGVGGWQAWLLTPRAMAIPGRCAGVCRGGWGPSEWVMVGGRQTEGLMGRAWELFCKRVWPGSCVARCWLEACSWGERAALSGAEHCQRRESAGEVQRRVPLGWRRAGVIVRRFACFVQARGALQGRLLRQG